MVRRAQISVAFVTLAYVVFSAAQVTNMASLWNVVLLILLAFLAFAVYFGKRWAMHTLRIYYALLLAWLGLWTLVMSSTRSPKDTATFTTMKRNVRIQAGWGIASLLMLTLACKKEKAPSPR